MLAVHYDNVINILLPSRCCWMPLPHGIVCIPCMLHECMCMQEIGYSLVTVHREPMGYKQSHIESVCVRCERQKVTENERAYCTGVHVCVHYSVTSALLYLYAERAIAEGYTVSGESEVTGVFSSSLSSGNRHWGSTYGQGLQHGGTFTYFVPLYLKPLVQPGLSNIINLLL